MKNLNDFFSGMHRCHEKASCWPDPTSKNGYFCKCHPGFKGNGNKQIHNMWTESNPEKIFENLAKNLTDELIRELDIKNSLDLMDHVGIENKLRELLKPGRKGSKVG